MSAVELSRASGVRVSADGVANPFANRGLPAPPGWLVDPEGKRAGTMRLLDNLERRIGTLLLTRHFDPARDRSRSVSQAYKETVQDSFEDDCTLKHGCRTFIPVPDGVGPGEEFVVNFSGETKQTVVTVPRDAKAGDLLCVKRGEDDSMELLDQVTQVQHVDLKLYRILVFLTTCFAIILISMATVLPYWIRIKIEDGEESFGPWGRHSYGYLQGWKEVDRHCALHPAVECQAYERLGQLSKASMIVLVATVIVQLWASISLLFKRDLLCSLGMAASVSVQFCVASHYQGTARRIVATSIDKPIETASSMWVFYCGVTLVALQALSSLGIWWEGRRQSRFKIMGAGIFLGLHTMVMRQGGGSDRFQWDEEDPAAGCPILWRTYGFTPSGLLDRYGSYWWGYVYAAVAYLASVPVHFLKTFDWNGIRRLHYGPPSEEEPVRKRGVNSTVVINYMLYRRSNIIMAFVFTVPLLWCTTRNLFEQQQLLMEHVELQQSIPYNNFSDFHMQKLAMGQNATFVDYSWEVLNRSFVSVTIWEEALQVLKYLLRLAVLLVAAFFSFSAMLRWADFKISRYLICCGWLAILMSPFIPSLIPSRNFVDWSLFDQVIARHLNEARVHYEIDSLALKCLYLDSPTLLQDVKRYSETFCDMVSSYLPYIMPESIEIRAGMTFNVPPNSLPWIGQYLPYPHTDLSFVHGACTQVQSVVDDNVTESVVHMVHEGCRAISSYFFMNGAKGFRTAMHETQDIAGQSVPNDPAHMYGSAGILHMLRGLPQIPIEDLPSGIPLAQKSQGSTPEHFSGPAVLLVDSKREGRCGNFSSIPESFNTFVQRPVAFGAVRENCELAELAVQANQVNAVALIVTDLRKQEYSLRQLSFKNLSVAIIGSKVDGAMLLHYLKNDRRGDVVVSAEAGPSSSQDSQLSRTSFGCRCKDRGYQSVCDERPPVFMLTAKDGVEAHPWCETMRGCPVAFDVCTPPGASQATQVPSKQCLPQFPCRRLHKISGLKYRVHKGFGTPPDGKHDVCATNHSEGYVSHDLEWMDCVPPLGLQGFVEHFDGKYQQLSDSGAFFDPSVSQGKLTGLLLVSKSCEYRLADISSEQLNQDVLILRIGVISAVGSQSIPGHKLKGEEEVSMTLRNRPDSKLGRVELQQRCGDDIGNWIPVPLELLRYVPSSLGSPVLQQNSNLAIGSLEHDTMVEFRHDAKILAASRNNDHSTFFRNFIGSRCHKEKRCEGDYQVCDLTWEDKTGSRGFCRCAAGYAWSNDVSGCLPEVWLSKQLVSELLKETEFQHPIHRVVLLGKALFSAAVSAKEGVMSLNFIIGHVLAMGPGMLISAWTAKLIFAHSAIPGYFCYFFPWIYSPLAWGLYNLGYQLFPDSRLFAGLLILAFWPIAMSIITLKYGLHKQMSIPRMMHVVNQLLLIYYMILAVGYTCLLWFFLQYKPGDSNLFKNLSTEDWLKDQLDEGDFSPRHLLMTYIATMRWSYLANWLVDSFAMFFYTCCAVTDVLIVCISREHQEAWLMFRSNSSSSPAVLWRKDVELNQASKLQQVEEGYSQQDEARPHSALAGNVDAEVNAGAAAPGGQHSRGVASKTARFAVEEEVIQDWLRLIHDLHDLKGPPHRHEAAFEDAGVVHVVSRGHPNAVGQSPSRTPSLAATDCSLPPAAPSLAVRFAVDA